MYCFGEARTARLLAARQAFALALPDPLAFRRDRCHPLFQRVAAEQRHRERDHGRAGCNRGADHRQKALVVEQGEQKIEHDQKSKLIILRITMTPMNIHTAQPASMT